MLDLQKRIAVDGGAAQQHAKISRDGWGIHTRTLRKIADYKVEYPDLDLPCFLLVRSGLWLSIQAVVTASEATADFFVQLLAVAAAAPDAPPAAQISLHDVLGDEGKAHLDSDAGEVLLQLLNLEQPRELTLTSLLHLPAAAHYFKASSLLTAIPRLYRPCFAQLTAHESLWLLQHMLESKLHADVMLAAAVACLPVFAANVLPEDTVGEEDLFERLHAYKFSRGARKRVLTCIQQLQLSIPWPQPTQYALLCAALCAAVCRSCDGNACSCVKIRTIADAAARAAADPEDVGENLNTATLIHAGINHCMLALKECGFDTGSVCVIKLVSEASLVGSGACACQTAAMQALAQLRPQRPAVAPVVAPREIAGRQLTVSKTARRLVLGAKVPWHVLSDCCASGKPVPQKLLAKPLKDHGAPWKLTLFRRADVVYIGLRNAREHAVQSARHAIGIASGKEQPLCLLTRTLSIWVATGQQPYVLRHWFEGGCGSHAVSASGVMGTPLDTCKTLLASRGCHPSPEDVVTILAMVEEA